MKHLSIILIIALCILSGKALKADNDKFYTGKGSLLPATMSKSAGDGICKSGFFLELGFFIPGRNFYMPADFDNDSGKKFAIGYCFEIGNRFKLADISQNSLNLRVSWFNVNYTYYKYGGKAIYNILQGGVIKLGPDFTYAIDDDKGIDVYYQFTPVMIFPIEDGIDGAYWGFAHSIGVLFQYKVFTAGMDFNFGNIPYWDRSLSDPGSNVRTNNLRLLLGFKF